MKIKVPIIIVLIFLFSVYSYSQRNTKRIIQTCNPIFDDRILITDYNIDGKITLSVYKHASNDTISISEYIYENEILYVKYYEETYSCEPIINIQKFDFSGNKIWEVYENESETDTIFYYYDLKGKQIGDSKGNIKLYEYKDYLIKKITEQDINKTNNTVFFYKYYRNGKLKKKYYYQNDTLIKITKYKYKNHLKIEKNTKIKNNTKTKTKKLTFEDNYGYPYIIKLYDNNHKLIWESKFEFEFYEE